MYKIEKFDCDALVVFSNAHHLTHSQFSIFDSIVLRWAVELGIRAVFEITTRPTARDA